MVLQDKVSHRLHFVFSGIWTFSFAGGKDERAQAGEETSLAPDAAPGSGNGNKRCSVATGFSARVSDFTTPAIAGFAIPSDLPSPPGFEETTPPPPRTTLAPEELDLPSLLLPPAEVFCFLLSCPHFIFSFTAVKLLAARANALDFSASSRL